MPKFLARLSKSLQKKQASQPDSKTTPGVGTLINQRYQLDAEIGRGGMGIVYRARDLASDRDVAVKIINVEMANSLTLKQFEREVEITSQLNHPHIVSVYETGTVNADTHEPLPYIVMELVRGTSLDEIHEFTYARVIDIGEQICEALEHAHDQGFVYRDLKPGNVILEKRGFHYFVKLLDFGLARPRGEDYLPNESSLAGSFFYLAPELINGESADVGSDLYALGATMYEMITGRVPFSNFDEQNVLNQHLEEEVAPPSRSRGDVPPALEEIVLRLLEKNPRDRFASALEVRRALKQINLAGASAARGNLPPANITGCDNKAEQVKHLFESSQLITLLDDDGTLTLALGTHLKDQFTDGVWLIEVEPIDEPLMVLPTVASILGVRGDANRSQTVSLLEHLREKNQLLIFKRCDHLLFACAQLIETILRVCPEVYVLASCSQRLHVPGEKCYQTGDASSQKN
jgi:serine/threonine protein kinase